MTQLDCDRAAPLAQPRHALAPSLAIACPVCGGQRYEPVLGIADLERELARLRSFHARRLRPGVPASALADRAAFTQDYATLIVVCRGCGLVLRNPRPSDSAIVRAYRKDHYGAERLDALFAAQLELFRPKARALARRLGARPRVVEIGSFVGGFLAAGREAGLDVLGIDPGEEVTRYCAAAGLAVFRGLLAEAGLAERSVDCIAIWNTFDQLSDPDPTLGLVRRILRPGGLLALRVPNGACFVACQRLCRRLPAGLDAALHAALAWNNLAGFPYLEGYSLPTLDRLLARHGFHRLEAEPDTLARIADAETRVWADLEERLSKAAFALVGRLSAMLSPDRIPLAPWLDAYYRVG